MIVIPEYVSMFLCLGVINCLSSEVRALKDSHPWGNCDEGYARIYASFCLYREAMTSIQTTVPIQRRVPTSETRKQEPGT